jgi:hypothetical protein
LCALSFDLETAILYALLSVDAETTRKISHALSNVEVEVMILYAPSNVGTRTVILRALSIDVATMATHYAPWNAVSNVLMKMAIS